MLAVILALDETNMLALAAAADPLRAANRQAGQALFEWRFATPGPAPVRLTNGLQLPADPIASIPRCDLLIVVASFEIAPQSTPRLLASLRRLSRDGAIVAGIDGGPWVLGAAGLLDGHRATVHWEDLDRFSRSFPSIDVQNARYVMHARRWTSGGAAPTMDMMLALITELHGAALSGRVAASMIHTPADPANPQHRSGPRQSHNTVTSRAQAMMEAALETPVPIATIARELGLGPRALQTHFRQRLGTTAQSHYLSLRLAEAHRQVVQTNNALQDIAFATGFSSPASFSRAFRAAFGTSASRLRAGQ